MPDASKTYIVNDQPIPQGQADTDALDFTPYVESTVDILPIGAGRTIGV